LKSVSYVQLIPILVQAIKELKKEIKKWPQVTLHTKQKY
jgi:hypothetical protein